MKILKWIKSVLYSLFSVFRNKVGKVIEHIRAVVLVLEHTAFVKNVKGSAIGFIISMVVIAILVSGLVGTVAYNLVNASENASVASIPGGAQLLLIIGMLFIVIPILVFARAAK